MSFFDIFRVGAIKQENEGLKHRVEALEKRQRDLGFTEYEQTKKALDNTNKEIADNNTTITRLREEVAKLNEELEKARKKAVTTDRKIIRNKELYKSIEYAIDNFFEITPQFNSCKIPVVYASELEELYPSVILKLHSMDMRDLRKAFNANNKQIDALLKQYEGRYTTKANRAIYQLMVIALRAELQNILYNLKYEKLDKSIDDLKKTTAKYLAIAAEGNQSIAGTMTKFIGEIEYLFINAIKIEYNYYVKKEQARQEQLAIKEQMRQEAEERKALEAERKKIEAEEAKFDAEISKIDEKLVTATEEEKQALLDRKMELEGQRSDVVLKKENIINLQNGKAGHIYIISNLGSFGDNMFKIGMTRRSNPQDRVNELGDASVPFRFDVHSFIFSEDAVSLETALHHRLAEKRVNKVNLRKEFFYATIDELEELVMEIAPTAEFNKTMLAEEFRQSQSTEGLYTSDYVPEDLDEE